MESYWLDLLIRSYFDAFIHATAKRANEISITTPHNRDQGPYDLEMPRFS